MLTNNNIFTVFKVLIALITSIYKYRHYHHLFYFSFLLSLSKLQHRLKNSIKIFETNIATYRKESANRKV